jgi:ABC-type Zn uptake system ZnuABC Zn-binding protein ZnuA/ABC-type Mn2+/Zn2+ transport system permease subunit
LLDTFQLAFVQRGLLEVVLLAVGAGVLGTWIVLRGLAFYSHAVGTAAFPGLVVADGLGFAGPLGAFAAALAFAGVVSLLARSRRSSYDAVTALALTGALSLGVILASDVFHSGSNIETLLFGSLLVIGTRDLVLAGVMSALALGATLTLGRTWLAAGFDPDSARSLGVRSRVPDAVLLALIALAVIASLSALGALLATALIVIPAATTRLVTSRVPVWQLATVALVIVEGVAGLWLSVETNAPPGTTIAVLSGGLFAATAIGRALGRARGTRVAAAATALALVPLVAGCGSDAGGDGSRIDVVATTTQIADWARAIGGDAVDVHQILKANTDPHDYEPRPSDVKAAAGADVVFVNGGEVDNWWRKLVDEAGGDPEAVELGERAPVQLSSDGEKDPHWWHDPRNVAAVAPVIGATLAQLEPRARAVFERRARAYAGQVRRLDRGIASCIGRIPRAQRKLVTDHDAFTYFAKRYGIEVIGAVIPSITTQAQPSARDVSQLVDTIEREHVRAVFPERSLSPKLAESIARETGARADYELYGDALGSNGSEGDTYLKMEAANADAIARGLSGGRVRCRLS